MFIVLWQIVVFLLLQLNMSEVQYYGYSLSVSLGNICVVFTKRCSQHSITTCYLNTCPTLLHTKYIVSVEETSSSTLLGLPSCFSIFNWSRRMYPTILPVKNKSNSKGPRRSTPLLRSRVITRVFGFAWELGAKQQVEVNFFSSSV